MTDYQREQEVRDALYQVVEAAKRYADLFNELPDALKMRVGGLSLGAIVLDERDSYVMHVGAKMFIREIDRNFKEAERKNLQEEIFGSFMRDLRNNNNIEEIEA